MRNYFRKAEKKKMLSSKAKDTGHRAEGRQEGDRPIENREQRREHREDHRGKDRA